MGPVRFKRPLMRGLVALLLLLLPSLLLAGSWGLRIAELKNQDGAAVTGVTPGGGAEQAGLAAGDKITHANGRKVLQAGDLARFLKSQPDGAAVVLTVNRNGWEKEVTIRRATGTSATGPLAPANRAVSRPPTRALRSRATGPLKATVAVGDFQVKAANASNYIGDGLREMLLTALHNTNKFIVVERIDIKGIAAEQALSRSDMARPDQTIAGAGMDIAEVMVYGAVTEFEAEASGSNAGLGFSSIPLNMSHKGKNSHMALDFRVADVRTGRLILTKRIVGSAAASMGSLAGSPTHRGNAMPFSFGAFKNTPMEKAIRDLVNKAVVYISNNLPERYYRHR